MKGGDGAVPKAEAEKVVANILNIPEHNVPVYKHGQSGCSSCGVKSPDRPLFCLYSNGGHEEMDQRMDIHTNVLVDVV